MNNLTKKQIDLIRKNTPAELVGKHIFIDEILGVYQKKGASANFKAGFIDYNGARVLVVEQFGEILGKL